MNIVATILGERSGRIKWDATWNLLAWLLDPKAGHGLADGVLKGLTHQVIGSHLETCTLRTEVNLGPGEDGKTKWPDLALFFPNEAAPLHVVVMDDVDVRSPNSSRKLANLLAYGKIAKLKYAGASIKVVAVTNAVDEGETGKVGAALQRQLGDENSVLPGTVPWHLVSLQAIGMWAAKALKESTATGKESVLISDFITWSGAHLSDDQPPPSIERTA